GYIVGKEVIIMLDTTQLTQIRQGMHTNVLHEELTQTVPPGSPITRRDLASPAPLSFEQQQVWQLVHLLPDTPVCHECVILQLYGPLDVIALERGLNELIRRHEVLHT